MDRFWGALAGCLTAASLLTLWLGAWGWSLILGLPGAIITVLLANDEIYLPLGPVSFLRVGRVWALDVGRRGVHGIGLDPRRIKRRKVRG